MHNFFEFWEFVFALFALFFFLNSSVMTQFSFFCCECFFLIRFFSSLTSAEFFSPLNTSVRTLFVSKRRTPSQRCLASNTNSPYSASSTSRLRSVVKVKVNAQTRNFSLTHILETSLSRTKSKLLSHARNRNFTLTHELETSLSHTNSKLHYHTRTRNFTITQTRNFTHTREA
jgi:hypothetical protein